MTPGHRWRNHPPKTHIAPRTASLQSSYFQNLKAKGYTWDNVNKRWIKGEWVDPPVEEIVDEAAYKITGEETL